MGFTMVGCVLISSFSRTVDSEKSLAPHPKQHVRVEILLAPQ